MTFSERVFELALAIPEGRVTTYGALAKAAGGGRMAARSITAILGKYPNHGVIPFHRIVYADGRVWHDARYDKKRAALYKREGIRVDARGRIEDFEETLFDFNELL